MSAIAKEKEGVNNDLKPYPAMKDSGVPWLREVPEHWAVLPNRALFTEVKSAIIPKNRCCQ